MMIFFWALLPLLAVNGQCKSWKQINIKVSKYDCWFEIEKVKVATMWKILSREMKPLQVIVTVLILYCNKIVHNCLITFMSWSIPPDFLHWASWLESLTQIFIQCPGPWNVSRVEWKPSGLQVPLTNKWSNDQVTIWPSDPMRKRPMTNLIPIENFLEGALIPVTLGDSHPLGRTALYEGDSYVIQYAVRCRK